MNIILRLIMRLILNYPGAYIRWLLFNKENKIEYYKKDTSNNYFVSMLVITLIIIIINCSKMIFE
jgi:hypothetical protein